MIANGVRNEPAFFPGHHGELGRFLEAFGNLRNLERDRARRHALLKRLSLHGGHEGQGRGERDHATAAEVSFAATHGRPPSRSGATVSSSKVSPAMVRVRPW